MLDCVEQNTKHVADPDRFRDELLLDRVFSKECFNVCRCFDALICDLEIIHLLEGDVGAFALHHFIHFFGDAFEGDL